MIARLLYIGKVRGTMMRYYDMLCVTYTILLNLQPKSIVCSRPFGINTIHNSSKDSGITIEFNKPRQRASFREREERDIYISCNKIEFYDDVVLSPLELLVEEGARRGIRFHGENLSRLDALLPLIPYETAPKSSSGYVNIWVTFNEFDRIRILKLTVFSNLEGIVEKTKKKTQNSPSDGRIPLN